MAKQIGAATYIECSALQSENSVRDIFHVATLACVNKSNKNLKRNKTQRTTKRISHMPSRPELTAVATDLRKDKAKSCSIMWGILVAVRFLWRFSEGSMKGALRGICWVKPSWKGFSLPLVLKDAACWNRMLGYFYRCCLEGSHVKPTPRTDWNV